MTLISLPTLISPRNSRFRSTLKLQFWLKLIFSLCILILISLNFSLLRDAISSSQEIVLQPFAAFTASVPARPLECKTSQSFRFEQRKLPISPLLYHALNTLTDPTHPDYDPWINQNDGQFLSKLKSGQMLPFRNIPTGFSRRFPNLLTFHPKIDCDNGRYLRVTKMFSDGMGQTMIGHTILVDFAMQLNLTQIAQPLITRRNTHLQETDTDRDDFWAQHHFQVKNFEWEGCPLNSSVRQNVVNVDRSLLLKWWGSSPEQKMENIRNALRGRHGKFSDDMMNGGLTIQFTDYVQEWMTLTRYRQYTQFVLQMRYYALNNQWRAHYYPKDVDTLKNDIHFAWHIRRGDMLKGIDWQRYGQKRTYNQNAIKTLTNQIMEIIDSFTNIKDNFIISIYSEGKESDYKYITDILSAHSIRYRLVLNGAGIKAVGLMFESDVVITAKSAMSSQSNAIFNNHAIKLFEIKQDRGQPYHCYNCFDMEASTELASSDKQTLQITNSTAFATGLVRRIEEKSIYPLALRDLLFLNDFDSAFE